HSSAPNDATYKHEPAPCMSACSCKTSSPPGVCPPPRRGDRSPKMLGTFRKISLPRRLIIDLMHASMRVPFVSLRRTLSIRALAEARLATARRPGWAAIFAKAFSLVARDEPVLRTLFVDWPWAYFSQLPR